VTRRRVKLVEATKQKKIFEKLKERQQARYDGELNLTERKDLDEIAGNGFVFRKRH
jgi:flagellar export protein FliJ